MEVWNSILILQIRHDIVVFQIVEIKRVQEISQTLLAFFQLIEEFLSVGPRLGGGSRSHMLLDLFPLFAVEFERLQEPEMLILGPAAGLVGLPAQFHVGRLRGSRRCLGNGLLLQRNVIEIISQSLAIRRLFSQLFVLLEHLGGLLPPYGTQNKLDGLLMEETGRGNEKKMVLIFCRKRNYILNRKIEIE